MVVTWAVEQKVASSIPVLELFFLLIFPPPLSFFFSPSPFFLFLSPHFLPLSFFFMLGLNAQAFS